nr:ribonuclease H-like domain-containing protein [Tanacetum cinerariifolium]
MLARHEPSFKEVNAALQTILTELQAQRTSRSDNHTHPEINPFFTGEISNSASSERRDPHNHHLKLQFLKFDGLQDDIRLDVKIKRPRTLAETIGVSRLVNERNKLLKKISQPVRPSSSTISVLKSNPSPSTSILGPPLTPVDILVHPLKTSFDVLLIRKPKNVETKDYVIIVKRSLYQALNAITAKDKYPILIIEELLDELYGVNVFFKLDLKAGFHQIRTWEDHLTHLQVVFTILAANNLCVKESKCRFCVLQVDYLGHIIFEKGVAVDPTKIQVVLNWPKPTNQKGVCGFLGLSGYYQKFIRHYGSIVAPLTQLLSKEGFKWNESAKLAFQQLKKTLTSPPVLRLLNFSHQFVIECDASGIGIRAVLSQNNQPVAYFSEALKAIDEYLRDRDSILRELHRNLSIARNRMKCQADQNRREVTFEKYATEVLECAGMLTCNPCRTPVDMNSKLSADVQQVCLFMHDPREPYFSALKRILRYVRGFRDSHHPDYVCLLQKSLYGLKQAPRAWFQRFAAYAARVGFHHTSSTAFLQQIITFLHAEFSMTDLGPLDYFFGVSVTRDTFGMFLSQQKYATEVLERAGMLTCNPCRTPVDTNSKLFADVQQVCLFMHDPREPHFLALKRILRYVRGTLSYGLQLYSSTTSTLAVYSDADWAGCPTTRRSTSGYCVFLGNNLLSWSSKTQFTISRSSAEAEYRGVANAVVETCWLRNFLRELHTPLSTATLVYCDNVSAVYLSSNPVQHQRKNHIEIDIHFLRDLVSTGRIRSYMFLLIISMRISSPKDYLQLYLMSFAPA